MHCKNCGKKLKTNEIFCSSCGYYNGDKQDETKDEKENSQWISGFIVVRGESENGCMSLFYAIDENLSLTKEPIASYPNKALSATANYNRPGTLTVHFEANRSGNVTSEYSFEKKEWTPINVFGSFDEIVWIN